MSCPKKKSKSKRNKGGSVARKKVTVIEKLVDLAFEANDAELVVMVVTINAIARKRNLIVAPRKERRPRPAPVGA